MSWLQNVQHRPSNAERRIFFTSMLGVGRSMFDVQPEGQPSKARLPLSYTTPERIPDSGE